MPLLGSIPSLKGWENHFEKPKFPWMIWSNMDSELPHSTWMLRPTSWREVSCFESYVTNNLNFEFDLEYQIRSTYIDIRYVLPSRKGRPPPIVIKFVRRSVQNLVFYNKKKLKKSQEKLSITESLTKRRLLLVMEAKKAFGFNNVWTNNGIVYCFYKEKRQILKECGDINK